MNEVANRAVVMAVYDAIEPQDSETLLTLMDTDMQIYQSTELPWGGIYLGPEEAVAFFENVTANLDVTLQFESVLGAADHVLVTGRAIGFAKRTGKVFDVPVVHLWQMDRGKVQMLAAFLDHTTILPVLTEDGSARPANGQIMSKFAIQQWHT
jgi:uncharacterized protein